MQRQINNTASMLTFAHITNTLENECNAMLPVDYAMAQQLKIFIKNIIVYTV